MLTVQGIGKCLGGKELFRDVSFHLHSGEKVGLIGPNGSGKTTLFQIMMEQVEPDAGAVVRSRDLRAGYLPQQWFPVQGKTVLAYAMDVDRQVLRVRNRLHEIQVRLDKEKRREKIEELALEQASLLDRLEHLGGYDLEARASKVLGGLGFGGDRLHQSVSGLSGGWGMRLELARLLLGEPDLLLLDEPTNHLDLDSLMWLETYLVGTPSAVVIISHDRTFLNRVVQRIFEIEQGRFQEYKGNYDSYVEEKARRKELLEATYKNQQERIRQVERFIERNRVRKDRARQVQSRLKLLEKMERVHPVREVTQVRFSFPEPPRSGRQVLELRRVHKAYDRHTVYSGIDLTIERGERIAFLGANGAGKSTLLKILAGVEEISQGERIVGHNVVLGYYAQYQWEQLRPEWTVLEEASSIAGELSRTALRSLLGAFLFCGDEVLKRVSVLSGGEKARLILCKLLLQRPNVLLLDEPTNHLDILSRIVLETALADFPGTLCFISHDRHFINAIATRTLLVVNGTVHLFPGNYDDYRNIWSRRIEAETHPVLEAFSQEEPASSGVAAKKDAVRKREEAHRRNELYRLKKPLQERLEETEARLEETQARWSDLNQALALPETYQDPTRARDLIREHKECQTLLERLTQTWEDTALAVEELEAGFGRQKEDGTQECRKKNSRAL